MGGGGVGGGGVCEYHVNFKWAWLCVWAWVMWI